MEELSNLDYIIVTLEQTGGQKNEVRGLYLYIKELENTIWIYTDGKMEICDLDQHIISGLEIKTGRTIKIQTYSEGLQKRAKEKLSEIKEAASGTNGGFLNYERYANIPEKDGKVIFGAKFDRYKYKCKSDASSTVDVKKSTKPSSDRSCGYASGHGAHGHGAYGAYGHGYGGGSGYNAGKVDDSPVVWARKDMKEAKKKVELMKKAMIEIGQMEHIVHERIKELETL